MKNPSKGTAKLGYYLRRNAHLERPGGFNSQKGVPQLSVWRIGYPEGTTPFQQVFPTFLKHMTKVWLHSTPGFGNSGLRCFPNLVQIVKILNGLHATIAASLHSLNSYLRSAECA